MTGGVVSTMVMVWLQVAAFPQASRACQVRVAVKVLPHWALVTVPTTVAVTPPHRSLADGASKFQATPHSTSRFGEQVMTGGVVSTTVMVWLQVAVLPQASRACHVRVAVKVLPHWALALVTVPTTVTFTEPSHRSLADGASNSQATPH